MFSNKKLQEMTMLQEHTQKQVVQLTKALASSQNEVKALRSELRTTEAELQEALAATEVRIVQAVTDFYRSLIDLGVAKRKIEMVQLWLRDQYEDRIKF